jgi:hypothetical protein
VRRFRNCVKGIGENNPFNSEMEGYVSRREEKYLKCKNGKSENKKFNENRMP